MKESLKPEWQRLNLDQNKDSVIEDKVNSTPQITKEKGNASLAAISKTAVKLKDLPDKDMIVKKHNTAG